MRETGKYICFTTLKDRWGTKLIDKFFPEPDLLVDNPYYKCSNPMKLYTISKVEKIEKYKRFIKYKEELLNKKRNVKLLKTN